MLDVATLRRRSEKTSEARIAERFVTWAIEEKSYSQRRACGLVGLDPKTYRYASRRPDDAAVRAG